MNPNNNDESDIFYCLNTQKQFEIKVAHVEDNELTTKYRFLRNIQYITIWREIPKLSINGQFSFNDKDCTELMSIFNDEKKGLLNKHELTIDSELRTYRIEFYIIGYNPNSKLNINIQTIKSIKTTQITHNEQYLACCLNAPKLDINIFNRIHTEFEIDKEENTINNTMYAELQYEQKIIKLFNLSKDKSYPDTLIIDYEGNFNKETRDIIVAYISFLLGRHLILFSEVCYSDGKITKKIYSPKEEDRYTFQIKIEPINYKKNSFKDIFENHLSRFIKIYHDYNMNYVLELYWQSMEQTIDLAIVSFQILIENLVESFTKINNNQSYVSKDEVQKKFGTELKIMKDAIKKEFSNTPEFIEPISNALDDVFLKSHSRRYKDFNKYLNIELNKEQRGLISKAYKIRHAEKLTLEELYPIFLFHLTYCNRIILSISGINEYKDFYTELMQQSYD